MSLFQLYERRTLAYIPSMPKGWQVQMGNVGQHYYRWLYGGPLPAPRIALGTPTPTQPTVPQSIDGTIEPSFGPVGTPFQVTLQGFRPGEEIVSWFTAPNGEATDARFNLTTGPDGKVTGISVSTIGLSTGQWAITYHGKGSNHESVVYFYLTPQGTASTSTVTATRAPGQTTTPNSTTTQTGGTATPTFPAPMGTPEASPTYPVVPTEPPEGLQMSVRPGVGPPSGQFTFSAWNLTAGENVQVKFTDPNGNVVYPSGSNGGQYNADSSGRVDITLEPDQAFPAAPLGAWLLEVDGQQSGLQGVLGFTLQ